MRRIVILTAVVVVGLAAYLTLWPVPIDPVAWSPPTAPELAGPLGPNHALGDARQLLEGFGEGPEDIVFDDRGRLNSGVNGGRIARIDPRYFTAPERSPCPGRGRSSSSMRSSL